MTLDDLRALGVSDAEIAELLAFSPSSMTLGGGQDEAARALAAAQATGVSNLGYVPVYGGGDIIPGTTQGILSKLGIENPYTPIFQTVGSENSGTAMDATERTTFAPTPGQTYRLVDNRTGETFGQASDPVGIKALVDRANALSEEQGKKANWDLQQSTLYSADPNKPLAQGWNTIAQDDPNTIPMSIKAMMAAMAVMTGAGVAQQINAAGAAASAGGAGGAGAGAVGAAGAGGAGAAGAGLGAASTLPAALAGDIIVTAGGLGAGLGVPAAVGGLTAAGAGAAALTGGGSGAGTGAGVGAALPTVAEVGSLAPGAMASLPANLAAVNAGAQASLGAAGLGGASGLGGLLGKLTSNMGVTDYLTAASLLGSAVGGGGGSGGTGPTTPYVSPFGSGPGLGAGMDYRAQPNIADYEQYGFGPEAAFFRPEYSNLVSGASAAPATPTYKPLI